MGNNHGHTVEVGHEHAVHHAHAHDDHHEESFVSKYIFSMDHKTISRQFLITAVIMAVLAMMMSIIFRMQLAWPGEKFAFVNTLLGDKWGKDGILCINWWIEWNV